MYKRHYLSKIIVHGKRTENDKRINEEYIITKQYHLVCDSFLSNKLFNQSHQLSRFVSIYKNFMPKMVSSQKQEKKLSYKKKSGDGR